MILRNEMASLIELVKRQALLTFGKQVTSLTFEENLTKLKILANKLTSTDVKLDKSLLDSCTPDDCGSKSEWSHSKLAPVTYIEVFENTDVTIGIFILKPGAKLPLHDHPLMYGVLKVLQGTIHILSYSPVSNGGGERAYCNDPEDEIDPCDIELTPGHLYRQVSLFAVKEPEMIVCDKDEVCVLSPRHRNIHEIHAINGPAAFLDILAPPYETIIPGVGPRPCRYFKEVALCDDNPIKKLITIPSPSDYWSDSAPYQGPPCKHSDTI